MRGESENPEASPAVLETANVAREKSRDINCVSYIPRGGKSGFGPEGRLPASFLIRSVLRIRP